MSMIMIHSSQGRLSQTLGLLVPKSSPEVAQILYPCPHVTNKGADAKNTCSLVKTIELEPDTEICTSKSLAPFPSPL